jgi:two-component system, NarL family, nitrate/nitrite response regulator NarL
MKRTHPRLTAREKQIARAVIAGLSNRQIGERLGISELTVRNRLTVLYHKLGASNRLQLAMLLTRRPELLAEAD